MKYLIDLGSNINELDDKLRSPFYYALNHSSSCYELSGNEAYEYFAPLEFD